MTSFLPLLFGRKHTGGPYGPPVLFVITGSFNFTRSAESENAENLR